MNSAVTRVIKIKELAYTDTIHNRSRRELHEALRRSAGEADAGRGSRRLSSNRTINAAKARMVTKKNRSLRTIGPIIAISRLEEGSTQFSQSSDRKSTRLNSSHQIIS